MWIEIGCGKRINQISEIGIKNGIKKFNLMDPLYKSENLKEKIKEHFLAKRKLFDGDPILKISSCNHRDQIFSRDYPILIARNSLEYMEINEIKEIFETIFINKSGSLILELTIPNISNDRTTKQANLYTEYQTFLSTKSIERLFESIGLVFIPKYNALLCGEQRHIISGTVYPKKERYNLYSFDNIEGLNKFITNQKELNKDSRVVMVGAGARNIMYIYNEGEKIVDLVVDSSPQRIGIKIGKVGRIQEHSQIKDDDILVILNNTFAEEIQLSRPSNIIATLYQAGT